MLFERSDRWASGWQGYVYARGSGRFSGRCVLRMVCYIALERCFFCLMFAGKTTEKIYRMYHYESKEKIQKII